jgi:LAO/AO transport system kinase
VEAPGLGDDVQAIKAGILEIADVLVVNKADRPGATNTVRSLKTMLELGHPAARRQLASHHGRLVQPDQADNHHDAALWLPPVIQTVAAENQGIDEVLNAVEKHRQYLIEHDLLAQLDRQHIEIELYERLREALMTRLMHTVPDAVFVDIIDRIQTRTLDPQRAVQMVLDRLPTP